MLKKLFSKGNDPGFAQLMEIVSALLSKDKKRVAQKIAPFITDGNIHAICKEIMIGLRIKEAELPEGKGYMLVCLPSGDFEGLSTNYKGYVFIYDKATQKQEECKHQFSLNTIGAKPILNIINAEISDQDGDQ